MTKFFGRYQDQGFHVLLTNTLNTPNTTKMVKKTKKTTKKWLLSAHQTEKYSYTSIIKVHFPNQYCSYPHLFGCQDALYDRYSISSCLSRSGPCSGQQILPFQGQRNGFLLDQSGLGPTQIRNRLQWGQ